MQQDTRVTIPLIQPKLQFSVEIPEAYLHIYDMPAIVDGIVVCACGGAYSMDETKVPVLVALDAQNGDEHFRVEIPLEDGKTEVATSRMPTVRSDGSVLLAVYQQDVFLRVISLARDGTLRWEDELGYEDGQDKTVEYSIMAGDMGIKHWFSPVVPGPEESYLLSWLYRMREAHMLYRFPGEAHSRWHADEWLVSHNSTTVFSKTIVSHATGPEQGQLLVARDLVSGEMLWERPNAELTVAALTDTLLLAIHRPWDFGLTWGSRRALMARTTVTTTPPALVALSPTTGKMQWSFKVDGLVIALNTGAGYICILVEEIVGQQTLYCLNEHGRVIWSQATAISATSVPAILAVDARAVLWKDGQELICSSIKDGVPLWRRDVALPEHAITLLADMNDRAVSWIEGVVIDESIYIRYSHPSDVNKSIVAKYKVEPSLKGKRR